MKYITKDFNEIELIRNEYKKYGKKFITVIHYDKQNKTYILKLITDKKKEGTGGLLVMG
jgi:hypothetical protein